MNNYKPRKKKVNFTEFRIIPKKGLVRVGNVETRQFEKEVERYNKHDYEIEAIREFEKEI